MERHYTGNYYFIGWGRRDGVRSLSLQKIIPAEWGGGGLS